MLTDSQREALAARLRRGRQDVTSVIPRRPAGMDDPPLSCGQEQLWFLDRFAPGLQFASLSFDASVHDMFMPLLAGAREVLAPAETLHSPPRLAALIRESRVTFVCLPPAVLSLLADEQFPDLHMLTSGGEELSAELARRWIRPGLRFINDYGPTEASVTATCAELDPAAPLPPPIGRPLPNYQAYVLDSHLNPVPAGVTGELHIGGAGVARGYLGQPELTTQRFIPGRRHGGRRPGRRFDVFSAHVQMMAGYQPAAPAVHAPTLIVSADSSPNAPTLTLWPGVLDGPVSTLRVDSDHYAFLRPPLITDVGRRILKWHSGSEEVPGRGA